MMGLSLGRVIDYLFPPHHDVVTARAISVERITPLYRLSCSKHHVCTALPYTEESVRALIRGNKYYNDSHSRSVLALVLREMLVALHEEHALAAEWEAPLIVPIPTAPKRVRERGFHQVKSIVREALSDTEGVFTYADVLMRKNRPSQTTIPKSERHANVAGAFFVPARHHTMLRGKSVILVDDITESGATLKDAARALCDAGALHLISVAVAK